MGMATIFVNGAVPFKQINTLLTESPMCNLVKIAHAVSEKKTFKNKMAAVVAILDFQSTQSYLFSI